jgi:hypothetical protein
MVRLSTSMVARTAVVDMNQAGRASRRTSGYLSVDFAFTDRPFSPFTSA